MHYEEDIDDVVTIEEMLEEYIGLLTSTTYMPYATFDTATRTWQYSYPHHARVSAWALIREALEMARVDGRL